MGKTGKVFVDEARRVLEKVVASDDRVVWKLAMKRRKNRYRLTREETPNIGKPPTCETTAMEEPLVLGCPSDLNALVLLHVEKDVFDSQRDKAIALECRQELLNGGFHNSFPSTGIPEENANTKKWVNNSIQ